jgi:hypothetical protein
VKPFTLLNFPNKQTDRPLNALQYKKPMRHCTSWPTKKNLSVNTAETCFLSGLVVTVWQSPPGIWLKNTQVGKKKSITIANQLLSNSTKGPVQSENTQMSHAKARQRGIFFFDRYKNKKLWYFTHPLVISLCLGCFGYPRPLLLFLDYFKNPSLKWNQVNTCLFIVKDNSHLMSLFRPSLCIPVCVLLFWSDKCGGVPSGSKNSAKNGWQIDHSFRVDSKFCRV